MADQESQEAAPQEVGQAGDIHADDIEELNHAVFPWDLLMRQMSLGSLQADIAFLQLDGILITRERWSNRILATGTTPEGYLALTAPCTERSFKWCGKEVDQSRVGCGFDAADIDFLTPDAADHLVVLVPKVMIVNYLGEEMASELLSQRNFVVDDPRTARELHARAERAIRVFGGPDKVLAHADEVAAAESDLLDSVSTLLIRAGQNTDSSTESRRYSACLSAIRLSDDLNRPIEVPELAAAVGVRRRVLERGFQEVLGVSPQKYLKQCRLNRLHRDLRAAQSRDVTVTEMANRLGFSEHGRMAGEYRRMFGELPSATLTGNRHLPDMRLADALAAADRVAPDGRGPVKESSASDQE
jgi:AraC family ethanolamine operon transcriptional activator